MIVFLLVSTFHATPMNANQTVLFRAIYTQVPDTDPEYGQGAIERNEVPHREIEHFVWLIQVTAPADRAEWQRNLNAAVDAKHGSFRVVEATPDDVESVASGKITLQK